MSHPEIEPDDRLLTEATARVTWGDFPEDVTAHLISQGKDAPQAAALVQRLVEERNREVRGRSGLKLVAGLAMTLTGGGFLYWYFKELASLRDNLLEHSLAVAATFTALGGLAAIWRGAWGLAIPSAEELTDVEEGEEPPAILPPLTAERDASHEQVIFPRSTQGGDA